MKRRPYLFNPYTFFLISVLGLGLIFFLFLYWYYKISHSLSLNLAGSDFGPNVLLAKESWPIMATLVLTLVFILFCLAILMSYYHKSNQLYRLQENFLNNFTHELKTPIASIRLYLETFLKYELSRQEQLEFVHYMLQDTQRLSHNVQQILQIGRLENKHQNYSMDTVDLEKYISDFLKTNQHMFPNGEINFKNLTNQRILMPINNGLFEILLMNLISNAFKYNDGPVALDIALSFRGRKIHLDFKDNGFGLDKSDLKRIFYKFHQGKANKKIKTKGGTGIGLYSAKQIVAIHKGKIWANSSGLGKGSTFTLCFSYEQ